MLTFTSIKKKHKCRDIFFIIILAISFPPSLSGKEVRGIKRCYAVRVKQNNNNIEASGSCTAYLPDASGDHETTRYLQWRSPSTWISNDKPSYLQVTGSFSIRFDWKIEGKSCGENLTLDGETAIFSQNYALYLSEGYCPIPEGVWHGDVDGSFSISGSVTLTNTSPTETFRLFFDPVNDQQTIEYFGDLHAVVTWDITVPPLASCTLNAPSSLQTPPIKMDELVATQTGEEIGGYRVPFSINVECSRDAKVTFKPQQVGGSCIGSNNSALRFCLESDSQPLDMSSGQASISVDGDSAENGLDIPLELKPHRGTSNPTAGKSSGVLEVSVTPD